jgi:hypothetical protein
LSNPNRKVMRLSPPMAVRYRMKRSLSVQQPLYSNPISAWQFAGVGSARSGWYFAFLGN